MRINYYSVFDKVARDYAPLFPAKNDDDAVRMFLATDAQQKEKNSFYRSDDYALYHICDFDEEYRACHHDVHLVEVAHE